MKGKFEHTCPECKEIFFGRKNREYCADPCKIKFNNDKAFKRREPIKKDLEIIKNSRNALEKMYDRFGESVFDISELLSAGYDRKVPLSDIEFDEKPGIWFRIGDFAYRPDLNRKKVQIVKIDNDEI